MSLGGRGPLREAPRCHDHWVSPLPGALSEPKTAVELGIDPTVAPARPTVPWALRLAQRLSLPMPGAGDTLALWDALSRLAAYDLTAARALEPHVDALSILDQAGLAPADVGGSAHSTWGVYAAEGPAGRLTAYRDGDSWVLDGIKPWCSLADQVSHALVTAWVSDSTRRLFAVPMADAQVLDVPWVARGLTEIVSAPVRFDQIRACPVGEDGWYLRRPGFWWGAIGVAACWYGGAAAVADRLRPRPGREPDQIAQLHLGAADAALHAAACSLREAAAGVDDPGARARDELTARRVRAIVRAVGDDIVGRVARATGPAPLTFEEEHARRVADLTIYLRQEHAERDLAALGAALA